MQIVLSEFYEICFAAGLQRIVVTVRTLLHVTFLVTFYWAVKIVSLEWTPKGMAIKVHCNTKEGKSKGEGGKHRSGCSRAVIDPDVIVLLAIW